MTKTSIEVNLILYDPDYYNNIKSSPVPIFRYLRMNFSSPADIEIISPKKKIRFLFCLIPVWLIGSDNERTIQMMKKIARSKQLLILLKIAICKYKGLEIWYDAILL